MAFAFAETGVAVVVFAGHLGVNRTIAEESRKFATNPKYEVMTIGVDFKNLNNIDTLVKSIIERFGRIDYNVNCLGVCDRLFHPKFGCRQNEAYRNRSRPMCRPTHRRNTTLPQRAIIQSTSIFGRCVRWLKSCNANLRKSYMGVTANVTWAKDLVSSSGVDLRITY